MQVEARIFLELIGIASPLEVDSLGISEIRLLIHFSDSMERFLGLINFLGQVLDDLLSTVVSDS